jgi:hypothetical protein
MRIKFTIAGLVISMATTQVSAQMAEKIDPVTGNYVPVRDPFLRDDPDPNEANPNRLGNRQSSRNSAVAAPSPDTAAANPNDGLTPAQRQAKAGAYNGQADPRTVMQAPDGSRESVDANGLISMGGMATYSPPGSNSGQDDPFAKPDWWPQ